MPPQEMPPRGLGQRRVGRAAGGGPASRPLPSPYEQGWALRPAPPRRGRAAGAACGLAVPCGGRRGWGPAGSGAEERAGFGLARREEAAAAAAAAAASGRARAAPALPLSVSFPCRYPPAGPRPWVFPQAPWRSRVLWPGWRSC